MLLCNLHLLAADFCRSDHSYWRTSTTKKTLNSSIKTAANLLLVHCLIFDYRFLAVSTRSCCSKFKCILVGLSRTNQSNIIPLILTKPCELYGTIVYYSFEFLQILYNNHMQRETLELVIMFWLHYRLSLIILYC